MPRTHNWRQLSVTPGSLGLASLPHMLDPASATGLAILNAEATRQGVLIGYINDFTIMTVLTLATIPLLLIMSNSRRKAAAGPIDPDETTATVEALH